MECGSKSITVCDKMSFFEPLTQRDTTKTPNQRSLVRMRALMSFCTGKICTFTTCLITKKLVLESISKAWGINPCWIMALYNSRAHRISVLLITLLAYDELTYKCILLCSTTRCSRRSWQGHSPEPSARSCSSHWISWRPACRTLDTMLLLRQSSKFHTKEYLPTSSVSFYPIASNKVWL